MPIDSCLSWMEKNSSTNIDDFLDIALQTLKRAEKTETPSKLAEIHGALSSWHAYNGIFPPDSLVYHSEKTLGYYQKSGNELKVADTYRTLAIDYINVRELDKSQTALFKAIAIYESIENDKGLGNAYRTLGSLYQIMEDFEKSVEYTNKAIPILEKTEQYALVAIAQFNLIIGYGELEEYDKAFKATYYCLELIESKAPEEVFVPVRAHSYRGDIYLKLKDYENALKDFIKAWELCKVNIGEERCATYRTEIGEVYLLQHEYQKALNHLNAGIKAYENKGQNNITRPYLNLSKTYEALGDFENALLYKDKAATNEKEMLEDKITNLKSEAVIKYETGKKDEALVAQAALLEQKGKVQTLIIAIACLLGILLIGLWFFFNKNKKKTKIIKAKNAENELLLKEIHHRVKNNLEMVKSLIALQSAKLEDSTAKEAMLASQNRVQSMGIIHQKLYQGENLGSIEMKDYFINLSEGILDSFDAEDKVKIECAMEQLELDVDTAVPIGLIVNELLTNALKYAFPDNTVGKINISLSKTSDELLTLSVSDNGVGKLANIIPKGTGFGSQ
ncbi:tetratricopeptide repeat-containing sensor histidine kinase, partial [Psychroserpens sp.]|uniref:tetratricopeptide repeat-containing sensor histidine kinase n=1 Tax=Psychroserpens sp. TaxID=2020870 RepID=UPI003C72E65B